MVMGRTHATQGAAAGLALSELAGASVLLGLGLAGIGAGAAVAADLDHANATATRSVGRITGVASAGIRAVSAAIYAKTKTRKDRSNKDGHRGITHTIPGALALGPIMASPVALATLIHPTAGVVATLALLWLLIVWSLRALPPHHSKRRDHATAAVLTAAAWFVFHDEFGDWTPLLLAATISMGTLVHIFGDGLTDYGVPLAFPFIVKGERWRSLGMPEIFRFKAGKGVEKWLAFPLSVAVVAVLLLRLYPPLWDLCWRLAVSVLGLG
jgi:membrane-bound metal-dependent hydrolase YbcI (DUF457 family)